MQKISISVLYLMVFSVILSAGQVDTVAVAPFQVIGTFEHDEMYSHGFPEAIAHDLSRMKNLVIVERLQMSRILDEMKLVQSGLIDEQQAIGLGHLLHANTMVIGTVYKEGDRVRVDARIIHVESGKAGISIEAEKKVDTVQDLFRLQKVISNRLMLKLRLKESQAMLDDSDKSPTGSEEAFWKFSLGLRYFDLGREQDALKAIQEAEDMDPKFTWPETVRQRAEAAFEELEREVEKLEDEKSEE